MAKAKRSFLKSIKKFSTGQTITLSLLTIVAGLIVGVVYGASQSDDCIMGQVYSNIDGVITEVNQSGDCDGGSSSGGSDSTGSSGGGSGGSTQPASPTGRITCRALTDTKIRWSASWANATDQVLMTRGSATVHRFRGANGATTSPGKTWDETGLTARTEYKGVLKNGSTRLGAATCKTKAAVVVDEPDDPISALPRDEDGNINDTFCTGNLCTTTRKETSVKRTTVSRQSGSTVVATVCSGEECSTHTTVSADPEVVIKQETECSDDNCVYKVYEETPPTGVRGFFVNLYLKVNRFFKNLI